MHIEVRPGESDPSDVAKELHEAGWVYPIQRSCRAACLAALPPEFRRSGPVEVETGWTAPNGYKGSGVDLWFASPVPGVSLYAILYLAMRLVVCGNPTDHLLSDCLKRIIDQLQSGSTTLDALWSLLS